MNVREIGPHRLSNRSLERVDYEQLTDGRTVSLLKTDPPWNEELMDYYSDLQQEQSPEPVIGTLSYTEMLSVLCDIAEEVVDGYVHVTTQADDPTTYALLDKRLHNLQQQKISYRDYDAGVYIGATDPAYPPIERIGLVRGLDAAKAFVRASTEPGEIVLDPMCGKGHYAEAAITEDRVFVGNDFNTSRIDEAEELITELSED